MRYLLIFLLIASGPVGAETCRVEFKAAFSEAIGTLAKDASLAGVAEFTTLEPLIQPGDGLSFTTQGALSITAPDGSALNAVIVDMHISRTEGSLDYISFNARKVTGDLGGMTIEADPILATWYGPRGTLPGLAFPTDVQWESLTKRRAIQMRIKGTVRYYFGTIHDTDVNCS